MVEFEQDQQELVHASTQASQQASKQTNKSSAVNARNALTHALGLDRETAVASMAAIIDTSAFFHNRIRNHIQVVFHIRGFALLQALLHNSLAHNFKTFEACIGGKGSNWNCNSGFTCLSCLFPKHAPLRMCILVRCVAVRLLHTSMTVH